VTLARLCRGCARAIPEGDLTRGRCARCAPAFEREKSRQRRATSTATRVRNTKAWRTVRDQAVARDGDCAHRHRGGCDGRLEVHHVRPIEQGGAPLDLANLLTLCRRHHSAEEARTRGDFLGTPNGNPAAAVGEKETRIQTVRRGESPSVG
jgi:5-methylcytosine-specific restriction endonuclease McrA